MCSHTVHPTKSLKQIYQIVANINDQIFNKAITLAQYYDKKAEVLSWVEVSHTPVVANKFVI